MGGTNNNEARKQIMPKLSYYSAREMAIQGPPSLIVLCISVLEMGAEVLHDRIVIVVPISIGSNTLSRFFLKSKHINAKFSRPLTIWKL